MALAHRYFAWSCDACLQGNGKPPERMTSTMSWRSASSIETPSPFRSMAAVPGTQEPATLTGGTLLTSSSVATPPTQVPSTAAPTAKKLEYLNAQLNTFGPDDIVLERFKLLGEWERRQGGAPRGTLMLPPGAQCAACGSRRQG